MWLLAVVGDPTSPGHCRCNARWLVLLPERGGLGALGGGWAGGYPRGLLALPLQCQALKNSDSRKMMIKGLYITAAGGMAKSSYKAIIKAMVNQMTKNGAHRVRD